MGYGFDVLALQQKVNEHRPEELVLLLPRAAVRKYILFLNPQTIFLLEESVQAQADLVTPFQQLRLNPGVTPVIRCSQLTHLQCLSEGV